MSLHQMSEGVELAALHLHLATAKMHDHGLETVFAHIHQHPAAMLGSAVDDAWLFTLETQQQEGEET